MGRWLQQENGATIPRRPQPRQKCAGLLGNVSGMGQRIAKTYCKTSVCSRNRTTPESQNTENHLRDSFPILPRMVHNVAFPDASEDVNSAHTTDTSVWQTFSVKGQMASVLGFVSQADCPNHSPLALQHESSHRRCLNQQRGRVPQHSLPPGTGASFTQG